MPDRIAYFNGEFIPLAEAKISAMDRGFMFGDGIYEVIPVYRHQCFRLLEHIKRLEDGLAAIRLASPHTQQEWQTLIESINKKNPLPQQSIYLQITRGPATIRTHNFPEKVQPTIFAYTTPLGNQNIDELAAGFKAVTLPDTRWAYCHIKTITLLPNILLKEQAMQQGAVEAILIRDGIAIEGTASNLFIVKNNKIITPPHSPVMLPGITRDLVMEVAKNLSIEVCETQVPEAELYTADEVWITSSTKEVMPIIQINDKIIANGKVGPMWQRVIEVYQKVKAGD